MPRKEKVIFKKRAFLNDDASMSGFVIAVLEAFRHNEDGEKVSSYPVLDFGDCSNKVSLDFSFYTKAQMKKARKKLEIVRQAVVGFADAFDKEIARFEEAEKSFPKTRRKKKKAVRERIQDIIIEVE